MGALPAALRIEPTGEWSLIRRATEGDPGSFEDLYREHAGRVFALCARMCGDRGRAEDLTQEVFVRAWRQLDLLSVAGDRRPAPISFRHRNRFDNEMKALAGSVARAPFRTRAGVMLRPANPNPDVSLIETDRDSPEMEKLHRLGVVLIRNAYSDDVISKLRVRVDSAVRRALRADWHEATHPKFPEGRTILGDFLGMEELRDLSYILLDPRIIAYAKRILGEEVLYFGDSSIRIGHSARGFHKDFQEDTEPASAMVRFALYLQDYSSLSGGLKIRLGSHRRRTRHVGTMMNVPSRVGDLVIFDLRTAHTGFNVRLKSNPALCLHPRIERIVPPELRIPAESERIVLLWTFSMPGKHLVRYLREITRRPGHWRRSGWNQGLLDLASRQGVTLLRAHPDQGSLLGP